MRAQRARARGTIERPYSALNLRLALALFGLVVCAVLGALSLSAGLTWLAIPLFALAAVAVVDAVVVELRRRARYRDGGGHGSSLFQ